jgi:hypothetical protein
MGKLGGSNYESTVKRIFEEKESILFAKMNKNDLYLPGASIIHFLRET